MLKRGGGLTSRKVETIKKPGLHADGGGLYLQVSPSGARSWILRFQIAGRRRDMGLGSAADIGLARARELAAERRRLVAEGVDPLEARKAAEAAAAALASKQKAKAKTFKQAAEALVKSRKAGWRNAKHAAQWSATLERYAHATIGSLPVGEIETSHIKQILEPIWITKSETASRLRGRIEAVLDYAKLMEWRSGDNPARWRGHLDHVFPARSKVAPVEHHAALLYAEMPAFWLRLSIADGLAARALELAILTACRSGEVLHARWPEVDLGTEVWVIPPYRTKTRAEHRVPLSKQAVALLKKLAAVRIDDHLFPGQRLGRPLSDMAMGMTLRRLGVDVTAHGFRATFRTWVAEETSAAEPVAEACLGHVVSDRVVAAYRRGDFFQKRRELMQAWADYIENQISDKVVPLRRSEG